MPPWERQRAAARLLRRRARRGVGIGVDVALPRAPGHAGVTLDWHPTDATTQPPA